MPLDDSRSDFDSLRPGQSTEQGATRRTATESPSCIRAMYRCTADAGDSTRSRPATTLPLNANA